MRTSHCGLLVASAALLVSLGSAQPSPSPSPPFTDTPVLSTGPPTDALDSPPTTFNVFPYDGLFELCFSSDCNILDASISIALQLLTVNTTFDISSNSVLSGDTLTDFANMEITDADSDGKIDPWITAPQFKQDTDQPILSATMYALTCYTGCAPRSSNADEFDQADSSPDSIGVRLTVQQLWTNDSIVSTFESYHQPAGGLLLDLEIVGTPPSDGQAHTLEEFAVTFLIYATENGGPVTSVTLTRPPFEGTMYLTRVNIGSEMYLDIPTYAALDGSDQLIGVIAKAITSGELKDLIQVTLLFGQVTTTIEYTAAIASHTMEGEHDSVATDFSGSSSSMDGPLVSADGTPVPTRMLVQSRGRFGLCIDASCTTGGFVAMGFSGLGTTASGLQLRRFADAPAFEFQQPQYVKTITGVEKYVTSFTASVPQSRERPPRPFDSSNPGSDPVFSASIEQFLTTSAVEYAGAQLTVPRGCLKFSINITQWTFASMDDTLVLNMSLLSIGSMLSGSVMDLSNASVVRQDGRTLLTLDNGKRLEMPMKALVDGVVKPIQIRPTVDTVRGGMILSFEFPAFTQSLYYDPVLGTEKLLAPKKNGKKKDTVDSWVISGVLLGLLALVIIVSIIKCTKRVKIKLDFSKIIP